MSWHVLGCNQGAFVPRYRVTAALVCAKGMDGKLRHCYRGDLIDWLPDDQREHFLRMQLIAPATEDDLAQSDSPRRPRPPQPVGAPAAFGVNEDIVAECVADLDRLDVAPDAGAPTARSALRDAGMRYGNDVIAAAVKARKDSHPDLSRTVGG